MNGVAGGGDAETPVTVTIEECFQSFAPISAEF
jgi:hypothetical protein